MAAINTAVQNSNSVQRNEGLALLAPAQSNTTRLEQLVALAQNPAEKPLARGQALAEIDGITGGRRATLQLLDGGAPQTASARTEASVLALNARTSGGDLWSRKVDGVQNQLIQESRLNRVGNPEYSRALATLSNDIAHGRADLPEGTYTRLNVSNSISTNRTNPLAIQPISPENSTRTIDQLAPDAGRNNAEITRLSDRNNAIERQLGAGGVNWFQRDGLQAEQRRNFLAITALQSANGPYAKAVNDARLQPDRSENGRVYRALADSAVASRPPVIYINGVNTDVDRSALQAMELSELFRAPVDHVVNVSSMNSLVSGAMQIIGERASNLRLGLNVTDMKIQQHLTGNPPAAQSAANLILDQLDNSSGKVKIVGYSQGAAIGSEALRMVASVLAERKVDGKLLTLAEQRAILSRIEFLGIGPGAATRHVTTAYEVRHIEAQGRMPARTVETTRHLPGLDAIDYRTISDANDPIARLLNVSGPNGETTTSPNLGGAAGAMAQMQLPEGILPHLSYFRTYEATDPGSIYNPQMSNALHQWYAGAETARNTIIRGANTGQ